MYTTTRITPTARRVAATPLTPCGVSRPHHPPTGRTAGRRAPHPAVPLAIGVIGIAAAAPRGTARRLPRPLSPRGLAAVRGPDRGRHGRVPRARMAVRPPDRPLHERPRLLPRPRVVPGHGRVRASRMGGTEGGGEVSVAQKACRAAVGRRLADVVVSGLALGLPGGLFLIVAALVRASSPGPVPSDLRLIARLALRVLRGGREAPARAGFRSQHA
jgi:hypothetical protein